MNLHVALMVAGTKAALNAIGQRIWQRPNGSYSGSFKTTVREWEDFLQRSGVKMEDKPNV